MGMPSSNGHNGATLVPYPQPSSDETATVLYTVHHSVKTKPRILVSWGNGNCLRLSYLSQSKKEDENSAHPNYERRDGSDVFEEGESVGKVVEVKLGKKDESPSAEKRNLAYTSMQAFGFLQNQKQQLLQFDGPNRLASSDWYVLTSRSRINIS